MDTIAPRYLVLAAVPLLAACATQIPGMGPNVPQSVNADARLTAPFLYVAECCEQEFTNGAGTITLYDPGLSRVARTIKKGVANPWFITVDKTGRTYMVSFDDSPGGGVTEYDVGSMRPSRHIKLQYAWATATDESNNLYVASCPTCYPYIRGNGSIKVYEAGTTRLLRSITKGIEEPTSLAFDTRRNLYTVSFDQNTTNVVVFAPGSSTPLRTLSQGYSYPTAIAFDSSNDLFVMRSPNGSSSSVVEYKADSDRIVRTITEGLLSPQAIAVDSSGTLYVANTPFPSAGWVSVYPQGAHRPSYRITSGMYDPQLVAVDRDGNLYVGNDDYGGGPLAHPDVSSGFGGSVCAYATHAKTPLRCITTPQYSSVYSLAIKPR